MRSWSSGTGTGGLTPQTVVPGTRLQPIPAPQAPAKVPGLWPGTSLFAGAAFRPKEKGRRAWPGGSVPPRVTPVNLKGLGSSGGRAGSGGKAAVPKRCARGGCGPEPERAREPKSRWARHPQAGPSLGRLPTPVPAWLAPALLGRRAGWWPHGSRLPTPAPGPGCSSLGQAC